MLLPFALIVTGCNGKLEKGSIFNEKFMKANFAPDIEKSCEYVAPTRRTLDFGEYASDPLFTIYWQSSSNNVKNFAYVTVPGKSGYFNFLENKYVLPMDTYSTTPSASAIKVAGDIRFPFNYKNEDGVITSFLYDEYGNKIFVGKTDTYVINLDSSIVGTKEGDEARTLVRVRNGEKILAYAFYNVDKTLKEVLTPEQYFEKYSHSVERESMKSYGHPELVRKNFSLDSAIRYEIFDKEKGKFISSFYSPSGVDRFFVGDYFYYQVERVQQEREKSYDFFDGTNKKMLETHRINYLTGKDEKIKTNIVFSECTIDTLYDEKQNASYLYFSGVREIQKDKNLSPVERSIILNQKFKEVADVSGINFLGIMPLGEYWTVDGTIYDSKMKEVGFIEGMCDVDNPRIVEGDHGFGLVDYTGKYIVQPVYAGFDRLDVGTDKTELYYGVKGNEMKLFKVEQEKATEVATLDTDKFNITATYGSKTHFLVQETETSKYFMFDVMSGSMTEYTPIQPSEYDYSYSVGPVTVRGGSLTFSANIYRKGAEWFAFISETKVSMSFRSSK